MRANETAAGCGHVSSPAAAWQNGPVGQRMPPLDIWPSLLLPLKEIDQLKRYDLSYNIRTLNTWQYSWWQCSALEWRAFQWISSAVHPPAFLIRQWIFPLTVTDAPARAGINKHWSLSWRNSGSCLRQSRYLFHFQVGDSWVILCGVTLRWVLSENLKKKLPCMAVDLK